MVEEHLRVFDEIIDEDVEYQKLKVETPAQLNKRKKQEPRVKLQKKIMTIAERNLSTNKTKKTNSKV